jgi:hypothetical protein
VDIEVPQAVLPDAEIHWAYMKASTLMACTK